MAKSLWPSDISYNFLGNVRSQSSTLNKCFSFMYVFFHHSTLFSSILSDVCCCFWSLVFSFSTGDGTKVLALGSISILCKSEGSILLNRSMFPAGICIAERLSHLLNTNLPICFTELGNVTLIKLEQPSKAFDRILITPFGIVYSFRFVGAFKSVSLSEENWTPYSSSQSPVSPPLLIVASWLGFFSFNTSRSRYITTVTKTIINPINIFHTLIPCRAQLL